MISRALHHKGATQDLLNEHVSARNPTHLLTHQILHLFACPPFYHVRTPSERLRGSLQCIAIPIWLWRPPNPISSPERRQAAEVVQMGGVSLVVYHVPVKTHNAL